MKNENTTKPKNALERLSRIDMFFYMISSLIVPVVAVSSVIYNVLLLILSQNTFLLTLKGIAVPFVITSAIISLVALITLAVEQKPIIKNIKSILFFPIFLLPLPFMSVVALVPKKVEWKPIKHNCIIEISEINRTANIA